MNIILTPDILQDYTPNVLKPVAGEARLLDKIRPQLELAEAWLADNITGQDTLTTLINEDYGTQSQRLMYQAVISHALTLAIPHLDLVLTPNGFGIVSNQNIVPASRDRIARLIATVMQERDQATAHLLVLLPTYTTWLSCVQADWFAATLFPDFLALCQRVGKPACWDEYMPLRAQLIAIEARFAAEYISPELYTALRQEMLAGRFTTPARQSVARQLRSIEANALLGYPPNRDALPDIVQTIRTLTTDFPEWHASNTAKLFSPAVFENNKISGGYWF